MFLAINYELVNVFIAALGFILALLGVILGQYIAFKTKITAISSRLDHVENFKEDINAKFGELYSKIDKKEDLNTARFQEIYKSMRQIELHLAKTSE